MYKLNKKNLIVRLLISITYWLKRRTILIMAAFMIGMSNGMYEEDKTFNDNQYKIEQVQKNKEKSMHFRKRNHNDLEQLKEKR